MFRLITILVAGLLVPTSLAAQTLQVRLDLPQRTTLPGIPVPLHATFTNGDGEPGAMPTGAALVIVTSAGPRSIAPWTASRSIAPILISTRVGRQPVDYEFTADGAFGAPGWFYTGFTRPGNYALQLYAGDYTDGTAPLESVITEARAVSNVVTLTVAEPVGADAKVWSGMKELAGTPEDWSTADMYSPAAYEFVKRTVREFPESAYAGWLATMGASENAEECFEPLREWLQAHPSDPYYEDRLLLIAELETNLAHQYQRTQPQRSQGHETLARQILGRLRSARSTAIRERVANRLEWLNEVRRERPERK